MRERPGSRRITGIGGVLDDGTRWMLPLEVALQFAEGGHEFRVGTIALQIVGSGERRYLRTAANRTRKDNLGALPTCPAP
jgi:hypothetical protein